MRLADAWTIRRTGSRKAQVCARGFTIALLAVLALALPATSLAERAVDQELFTLLNAARAEAGQPDVACSPTLSELASRWSARLADQQHLAHRPLGETMQWVQSRMTLDSFRVGENVATGTTALSIHHVLMASKTHRENALGNFTYVGIGSTRDAEGRLWVAFNFVTADPAVVPAVKGFHPVPFDQADRAIVTAAQSDRSQSAPHQPTFPGC